MEKVNKKTNCNIVINQQPSLHTSERSTSKTKTKDQKRVELPTWAEKTIRKN